MDEVLGDIMDSSKLYLYPHLHFKIGYNVDQIVALQISTDVSGAVCIFIGACIEFALLICLAQ
jgi:hypothetical protein